MILVYVSEAMYADTPYFLVSLALRALESYSSKILYFVACHNKLHRLLQCLSFGATSVKTL